MEVARKRDRQTTERRPRKDPDATEIRDVAGRRVAEETLEDLGYEDESFEEDSTGAESAGDYEEDAAYDFMEDDSEPASIAREETLRRDRDRADAGRGKRRDTDEREPRRRTPKRQVTGIGRVWMRELSGRADDLKSLLTGPLVLIGAGTIIVALVVMLVMAYATRGVDPEAILKMHQHVAEGRLPKAEAALAELAGDLPEALNTLYAEQLEAKRAELIDELRQKAARTYKDEMYKQAVDQAKEALALGSDADALWLAAEGLRQLKRHAESEKYYTKFIEQYVADKRKDDAIFWRADAYVAAGKIEEAKKGYQAVIDHKTSEYKRAAAKRLAALQ